MASQIPRQEQPEIICPNCNLGHYHIMAKPFLRLFRGQIFTIPNAVCYQCDICGYYEFDSMMDELIRDMTHRAILDRSGISENQRLSPPSVDDESLNQQNSAQI